MQKRGSQKTPWLSYLVFSFLPRLIFATSLLFFYLAQPGESKPVGKGGKPGELLTYGVGARAFGMGRAFSAIANDATATVWNPGGLGVVDRSEITALHSGLFADTNLDFLSVVLPSLDGGTFGLSVIYLSSAGFEGRDANNIVTDPFTNTQMALGGSYGVRFSDRYSGGLSIKYFTNALANTSSGAVTFALGLMSNPVEQLWMGLTVSNLISMEIGDPTSDKIPAVIRGGISYHLFDDQMVVGADYDSNYGGWYLGGEYRLFRPAPDQPLQIYLRGGANYEELAMGFGAWYQEYGIDYAFSTMELGGSHRFSMTVRFGDSMSAARLINKEAIKEAKKKEAQLYYADAQESFKNGRYEESSKRLDSAQESNPEMVEARLLKDKIGVVSRHFKQAPEDAMGGSLRQAVSFWVDGDVNLAMDAFTKASTIDPENTQLQGLIKEFKEKEKEGLRGRTASERAIEPVALKLSKARDLWMQAKYAEMVPLCQEAIQLDPNNVEANLLLGTANYSIGLKKEAIESWKRARQYGLQRNPDTGLPFLSDVQLKQLDDYIKRATEELKGAK